MTVIRCCEGSARWDVVVSACARMTYLKRRKKSGGTIPRTLSGHGHQTGRHWRGNIYISGYQHVRQLVFTHRLGQRQASVDLAARVVEVRMVKNS
jgi:hypothetical protein